MSTPTTSWCEKSKGTFLKLFIHATHKHAGSGFDSGDPGSLRRKRPGLRGLNPLRCLGGGLRFVARRAMNPHVCARSSSPKSSAHTPSCVCSAAIAPVQRAGTGSASSEGGRSLRRSTCDEPARLRTGLQGAIPVRSRHSRTAASPPASLPSLAVPLRVRLDRGPRRSGRIGPLGARPLPERPPGRRPHVAPPAAAPRNRPR